MYDKEAVAAVEAAGLDFAGGMHMATTDGYVTAKRSHPTDAVLHADQLGAGTIFHGKKSGANKFIIDKDGNISLVGTVDGVKISGLKTVAIASSEFITGTDTNDWIMTEQFLRNNTVLTAQLFYAPVILPDGATVSKLTLYGYRNDELATMSLILGKTDGAGAYSEMAQVDATWTDGYNSGYDDTINFPLVDNANYVYMLRLTLEPNDDALDVRFCKAKIELA